MSYFYAYIKLYLSKSVLMLKSLNSIIGKQLCSSDSAMIERKCQLAVTVLNGQPVVLMCLMSASFNVL